MPQYKTKDLYENCHPVIAEHLKRGEAIWCKVWDDCQKDSSEYFVNGYDSTSTTEEVYQTSDCNWKHAEPIPQKQKVRRYKKASEIIAWLEERGGSCSSGGDWHCEGSPGFVTSMSKYCGKTESKESAGWSWHPDWIEETEE